MSGYKLSTAFYRLLQAVDFKRLPKKLLQTFYKLSTTSTNHTQLTDSNRLQLVAKFGCDSGYKPPFLRWVVAVACSQEKPHSHQRPIFRKETK
jgi:hypothetical protein